MKKNSTKRFLSLAALGLGVAVAAAGQVRADSVAYTDSIRLTNGSWSANFTLTQFNPSLGTLTEVDFSLDGAVTGSVTAKNTDVAPEDITTNIGANLKLKTPGGATTIVLSSPDWMTTDLAVAVGASVTHDNETGSDPETNSYTASNGTKFTQFIGTGNITLPLTASSTTSASASGNVNASLSTKSSADVTVTYDYTPATPVVPEPATVSVVLLAGAIGAGAMLRRHRNACV